MQSVRSNENHKVIASCLIVFKLIFLKLCSSLNVTPIWILFIEIHDEKYYALKFF